MLLYCQLIHPRAQVEPPPPWRDPTQVLVQAERQPVDTSGWSDFKESHRNPHAKKSSLKDGESPEERWCMACREKLQHLMCCP